MDDHGQAPCLHLQVDDDQHGECLIGRSFPAACQIQRSGAVGCAAYEPTCQLADWEALRIVARWRVMRAYYTAGAAPAPID
jgi:hypothetical protein